ncbi:MAG: transcription elongation factor Spt5 [Candidatus Marsarchaeota archaeon]|nr:transcription elongation factor Spt5 [Candidatus Marsarchaeota archaeon]MCL5111912.1 transcription elongation factor Spt5 [Candidatus Marsarchaeota archaeon]
MFFVVKVTSGQEKIAASMLQNKLTKEQLAIYSIIVVEGMRGYIVVEAEDEITVRTFITKERNIRGILPKPLSEAEVDKLLEVKSYVQEIHNGDTVEFTSGPFKGYKARVLRVDDVKSDMTVELMDVVVPIPITTKMNTARIIQKAQK